MTNDDKPEKKSAPQHGLEPGQLRDTARIGPALHKQDKAGGPIIRPFLGCFAVALEKYKAQQASESPAHV